MHYKKKTNGFVDARINTMSVILCYKNTSDIDLVEMVCAFIPVKKGDVLTFSYTTTDTAVQYYTMFGLR